jgi:pyruvate ferredoxin oxidoreductase gamma subunit
MINFVLYGRGGQGIESATRMIGNSLFSSGLQVQDFVVSGMEKRGFPVYGYVKAEKAYIPSKDVPKADFLLVFDLTLPYDSLLRECNPKATVVFNSKDHVKNPLLRKMGLKSYIVNANEVSYNHLRRIMPNTVMLSALPRLFPKITMKSLKNEISRLPNQHENILAFESGLKAMKRN